LQITRFESTPALIGSCCSSLAEHSLGKGEVESSILSSSTIILINILYLQGVSALHPISPPPLSPPFLGEVALADVATFYLQTAREENSLTEAVQQCTAQRLYVPPYGRFA
jgi:hypothetical protein